MQSTSDENAHEKIPTEASADLTQRVSDSTDIECAEAQRRIDDIVDDLTQALVGAADPTQRIDDSKRDINDTDSEAAIAAPDQNQMRTVNAEHGSGCDELEDLTQPTDGDNVVSDLDDDCRESPHYSDPMLRTRPRTMHVVPRGVWSLWTKLCEIEFSALTSADTRGEERARAQALRNVMATARRVLQLPSDRVSTQSYSQWLNELKVYMRSRIAEASTRLDSEAAREPEPRSRAAADSASPTAPTESPQSNEGGERTRGEHMERNVKKAQSKMYQGYVAKAFAALSSKGAHSMSAESIDAMRSLHPTSLRGSLPTRPHCAQRIAIDDGKLIEVIRHINNGSAPGVSGWTGSHIELLVANEKCLRGIAVIVRLIINGDIPHELRDLFLAAPLTDLRKGEDGSGHRPIAPGEIFYRIATRYALTLTPDSVKQSLFPSMQYGAGKHSGQERALHLMRTARAHHATGITIKIDTRNAFNTVSRAHIANVLYSNAELSHLWRLFEFAYGQSSPLIMYHRGEPCADLASVEGVKQGDSLGSFLFCLAIQSALRESCRGLRCQIIAFVDDASIIGPTADCLTAFKRLRDALSAIGLEFAMQKCAVLYNGRADGMPESDKERVREAGLQVADQLTVLGCCITEDDTLMQQWMDRWLAGVRARCAPLAHAAMRTQSAMLLLRQSLNASADYLMRVLPPRHSLKLMAEFDTCVQETFLTVAQIEPPQMAEQYNLTMQRARLPIAMGGLGLASKHAIAPIAWYASLLTAVTDVLSFFGGDLNAAACSLLHVELVDAEMEITATNPQYELTLPEGVPGCGAADSQLRASVWSVAASKLRAARAAARRRSAAVNEHGSTQTDSVESIALVPPGFQRTLTQQYHLRCKRQLLRAFKDSHRAAEQASLLSASQRNSALWLTALPTESRYRLRDEEARHALRLRLHLPPRELEQLRTTACPCGAGDLQQDPLHFHSCALLKRTAATARHDLVLQTLSTLASELRVPHTVEPRPLEITGEDVQPAERPSREKPDLLLITASHHTTELLTDVAIVHPAAASYVDAAAVRPLSAAKSGETRKESKYGHLVRRAKHGVCELKGFAMESFGAFGPHADYVLKCLLKHADGSDDSPQLSDARTRLSIALQRGNARIALKGIELICAQRDELPPPPPHRPRACVAAVL
jgi:hypothetical protein